MLPPMFRLYLDDRSLDGYRSCLVLLIALSLMLVQLGWSLGAEFANTRHWTSIHERTVVKFMPFLFWAIIPRLNIEVEGNGFSTVYC